jgi:DNA-binding PadR family transcriptional regulator
MSNLSFLVLTALADEPRHGYSVLQEIQGMTAGKMNPAVATLYRTLDRLATDGLVEEAASEVVDGRFRRTYRLTRPGADALAAEASVRAATARLASRRLKGATPTRLAGGLT